MKHPQDSSIDQAFAPLRAVSAPQSLQRRVDNLTKVQRRPSQKRFVFAFAAASAILAISLFAIPQRANAGLLERMGQAVMGAKSAHMIGYSLTPQGWKQTQEIWYAGENWRMSGPEGIWIYAAGKKWTGRPDQHIVLESDRMPGEMPPGVDGAFAIGTAYAAMNRKGFHFQLTYGKPEIKGGQTLTPVTVTREGHDTEREAFWVLEDRDLPIYGEHQILDKGVWRARMRWECSYDGAVPATVFAPSFPAGTKILDRASFISEWKSKLRQIIVSAKVDGEVVQIRDAYLNTRGELFLLWTGKIGGRDYRLTVRDDHGREYTRAGAFDPGAVPPEYTVAKPLYVDGQLIDGACFVPVEPIETQTARSFALSVVRSELPPPTDGVLRRGMQNRPFEPQDHPSYSGKVVPTQHKVGQIEIPAVQPESSSFPAYMPLFGAIPASPTWAEHRALMTRKHYWMLRMGPEYQRLEVYGALVPPLTLEGESFNVVQLVIPGRKLPADSDPQVLRKLETLERQIIALDERGIYGASGFDWFELSAIQQALGKSSEAEESLKMAEAISPEIRWRGR